jgi:hypothetical protein
MSPGTVLIRWTGRVPRLLLVFVGCAVVTLGVLAAPADAQPAPGPTESADRGVCTPIVPIACTDDVRKGADTRIPGLPMAQQAAGIVAGSLAGVAREIAASTVGWYIETLVSGLSGVLGEFTGFVDATAHPRVTAEAFLQPGGAYHTVASISVLLLTGFVFLGVIQGLAAGEPGQALFRLLRDIPVAVLAILGFPWLVDQLLAAADGLSAAILPSGETTRKLLTNQLLEAIKLAAGGGIAALLIGVLAFAALILVYLELVVRDVLIYLVVGLASLSYAAMVWPAARGAARKAAELAAAAILAKPAIFLALRIGLDLTTTHGKAAPWQGGPWGRLLVGLAIVCVAAFTPWVIWRLIPHAEAMLVSQGMARGPARAAMQTLQTAYWADAIWSRASFHRGGGKAGGDGEGTGGPRGPGRARSLPDPGGGTGWRGGGPAKPPTPSPGGGAAPASAGAGGTAAGGSTAGGAAAGAGAAAAAAGPAGAAAGVVVAGAAAAKAGKDHVTSAADRQAGSAHAATTPASPPPDGAAGWTRTPRPRPGAGGH